MGGWIDRFLDLVWFLGFCRGGELPLACSDLTQEYTPTDNFWEFSVNVSMITMLFNDLQTETKNDQIPSWGKPKLFAKQLD